MAQPVEKVDSAAEMLQLYQADPGDYYFFNVW